MSCLFMLTCGSSAPMPARRFLVSWKLCFNGIHRWDWRCIVMRSSGKTPRTNGLECLEKSKLRADQTTFRDLFKMKMQANSVSSVCATYILHTVHLRIKHSMNTSTRVSYRTLLRKVCITRPSSRLHAKGRQTCNNKNINADLV